MRRNIDELDDRVKAYYEAWSFDADQLEALRAIAERRAVPSRNGQARQRVVEHATPQARDHRWIGLAAAVAIVVLAGILVAHLTGRRPVDAATLVQQVATEVAVNHRKSFSAEVKATSFDDLAPAMPKLGFTPVRPERLPAACYRVAGARYCSIRGSMAVQIKLTHDEKGYTLYQFQDSRAYSGMGESRVDADDVRVTVWREGGLVMGLAGPRS